MLVRHSYGSTLDLVIRLRLFAHQTDFFYSIPILYLQQCYLRAADFFFTLGGNFFRVQKFSYLPSQVNSLPPHLFFSFTLGG